MGIFQGKKIKLDKVNKEGGNQYFIDYDKLKEPDGFLFGFMQNFIENKNSLFVIDTDNFYVKKQVQIENSINELKKELESQEIPYEEVIIKKDDDNKIFGVKLQSSKKVNSYKLGLAVTPDQIGKVTGLVKNYNLFCFIPSDIMDTEELMDRFLSVRGNYDDLNDLYEYDLFNDCFFHRMRICSKEDIIQSLELKLQKYQS